MNAAFPLSLLVLVLLLAPTTDAEDSIKSFREYYEQPLCGLLAAFAGVESAGIAPKVSLNDLCERGLVGDLGSTARQIEEAIELLGGATKVIGNCTLNELTLIQRPAIIHVSSGGANTPVDHWILLLGVDGNGNALIAEPPSKAMRLGLTHLNAIWDGLAIVIIEKRSGSAGALLVTSGLIRLLGFALLIGAGLLCLFTFQRFTAGIGDDLRLTIPSILAGAVAICVVRNLISPDSLFMSQSVREISALAAIESDFVIPVIDVKTFSTRPPSANEVIVDTRMARDFRLGAIEGAINIPVNVTLTEFMNRCSTLSKDTKVYLYCQSSKCKYSDIVALRMARNGFTNICVIRDGYVAWNQIRGKGGNLQ